MTESPPPALQDGLTTTNIIAATKVNTREERLSIRKADCDRLKRNLENCTAPFPNSTRKVDFMAGLFVTTLFTTISLWASKTQIENWIYAVLITIIVFSLIFVWEFNKVASNDLKRKKIEIDDIKKDMEEIEKNLDCSQ
jgi:hypothetical protein